MVDVPQIFYLFDEHALPIAVPIVGFAALAL
jgi:hypothetical protein